MSTRSEIELRKSQTGLLLQQMLKDGQLNQEQALELLHALTDFMGNGTSEK